MWGPQVCVAALPLDLLLLNHPGLTFLHVYWYVQVLIVPVMSHAVEEDASGSQVVDTALVDAIAADMLGLGQISTSQPGDGKEESAPSGSSNDTTAHLVCTCSHGASPCRFQLQGESTCKPIQALIQHSCTLLSPLESECCLRNTCVIHVMFCQGTNGHLTLTCPCRVTHFRLASCA